MQEIILLAAGGVCSFLTGLVGVHVTEGFNLGMALLFIALLMASGLLLYLGFKPLRKYRR
jgi:hypothetical protein